MSQTINYFKEITKYPRPSKKEEKIRNFLINFFSGKGYNYKVDNIGNLIVYIPSKNSKSNETIILQSHMDMVCVKSKDSNHDFLNDPILFFEKDGYITAGNTTLGADDGIGIALCMASCDFNSHPNLELVFTIDEEDGMSGVMGLDFSLLNGNKIINLDNEDDDEICISSAGGNGIIGNKNLDFSKGTFDQYEVNIFGMKGGHSGVDIDKNRGNIIYAFFDFINNYNDKIEISFIESGFASNVIPSKIKLVVGIKNIDNFKFEIGKYLENLKKQYDCPLINFEINKLNSKNDIIKNIDHLIKNLYLIKNGVYSMSSKIDFLVQTSINLGILKIEDNKLKIVYLARSSNNKELIDLTKDVSEKLNKLGFELGFDKGYLGWQDDKNSELLKISKEEFEKIHNFKIKITAVHAGLECGNLVSGLNRKVNAISIGPNIKYVHSIEEKVEIKSIEKIENILEGILKRL